MPRRTTRWTGAAVACIASNIGAAKAAWIRAARSTQTFGAVRTVMNHCRHVRSLSVPAVVVSLAILATAQVANSKKFNPVPQRLRNQLVARFNLYIEYERTRQYEKLWPLLSQAYIANQHLTRENYLRYRSDDTLLEFKPNAVIKSPMRGNINVFEIHGIAKFQRGTKTVTEDRLLEARLEGDEWYFSDWLVQVE